MIKTDLPARMGNTWPYITEPLRVGVAYSSSNPLSVELHIQAATDEAVWEISRDMLFSGVLDVKKPVGLGDISIKVPRQNTGVASIRLVPSNPGDDAGTLFILVPRNGLVRFLTETYKQVPWGHEEQYLDIDGVVKQILERGFR